MLQKQKEKVVGRKIAEKRSGTAKNPEPPRSQKLALDAVKWGCL
jgi:hypothetical protein